MKKILTLHMAIGLLISIFNTSGSSIEPLNKETSNDTLYSIAHRACNEIRLANQSFIKNKLYPRQQKLRALRKRVSDFFLRIFPYELCVRLIKLTAPFHLGAKKTLNELGPYIALSEALDKAISENSSLIAAIHNSTLTSTLSHEEDYRNSPIHSSSLSPEAAPKKSIKDTCNDLCELIIGEDIEFYTQSKTLLETYLTRLHRITDLPEQIDLVNKETQRVTTEIKTFESLIELRLNEPKMATPAK
jgi:hypothetical protein